MKYILSFLLCCSALAQQTVNNFAVKTNLTVSGSAYLNNPVMTNGFTSGPLTLTGVLRWPVTTISTNYTLNDTQVSIDVDDSAAGILISFPAPSGRTGQFYVIKKISTGSNNTVLVGANSGTDYVLAPKESVLVESNGSSWNVKAGWKTPQWDGDLRAFGIVMNDPNEATNNLAKWNSAVAFAETYDRGVYLTLPPGEFYVPSTLSLGNHKYLQGSGQASSALSRIINLSLTNTVIQLTASQSYGHIRNIVFAHDPTAGIKQTWGYGLYVGDYVQKLRLEDVATAFCSVGFYFRNHFDCVFDNLQARPFSEKGIMLGQGTHSVIYGTFRGETAVTAPNGTVSGSHGSTFVTGSSTNLVSQFAVGDYVCFGVIQRPRMITGITNLNIYLNAPIHRDMSNVTIRLMRTGTSVIDAGYNDGLSLGLGNIIEGVNAEWSATTKIIQYANDPYAGSTIELVHIEGWYPWNPSGGTDGAGNNLCTVLDGTPRSKVTVRHVNIANVTLDGAATDGVQICNGLNSLELDHLTMIEVDRISPSGNTKVRPVGTMSAQHAPDIVIHRVSNATGSVWTETAKGGSLRFQRGEYIVGDYVAQRRLGGFLNGLGKLTRYGDGSSLLSSVWVVGDRFEGIQPSSSQTVTYAITTAGNDTLSPAGTIQLYAGKTYFSADAAAWGTPISTGISVSSNGSERRTINALPLNGFMATTNAINANAAAGSWSLSFGYYPPNYSSGDWIVIDPGTASEEVVIGGKMYFGLMNLQAPLQYSHSAGALVYNVGRLEAATATNYSGSFSGAVPSGAVAKRIGTQSLETTDSPQFAGVNLGNATDTTLARVSAGVASVEGNTIITSTTIRTGTGSPEGVVTAPVGTLYLNSTGGAGTTLYVKESGTGNTGWIGK